MINRISGRRVRGWPGRNNCPPKVRETPAFLKGILHENIKMYENGRVGILLWDQWLALLRDSNELGKVLVSSRNSHAVLGEFRQFPALTSNAEETHAADEKGLFLDFAAWDKAMAWHESCMHGCLYKIEISGKDEQPFFRISLTQDSDRGRFFELVQSHQGWAIPWNTGIVGQGSPLPRISPLASAELLELPLERGQLWNFLDELAYANATVEIDAASAGARQIVRFAVSEIREMHDWVYLGGQSACAHLQVESLPHFRWSGPPREICGEWIVQGLREDFSVAFQIRANHFLPSFE